MTMDDKIRKNPPRKTKYDVKFDILVVIVMLSVDSGKV